MNQLLETVEESALLSGISEALGTTPRKLFEYLGLFCVLVVIYSICFSGYLKFVMKAPAVIEFSDLMKPLIKYCVASALPLAAVAYFDSTWRSSDAAPVCVAAWLVSCSGLSFLCGGFCPIGAIFPFVPFVVAALAAHAIGALFRPKKLNAF
jgi:hypothetical protein